MCDPVSIGLAAVSAATSIGGSIMQSSAAQKQANAVAQQNMATAAAQNEAFNARMAAARQQTAAQTAASQQTIADRSAAANQMREQQMSALQNYQKTLDAENQQAEVLRQAGDTAAQQTLQDTSAQQLQAAQEQRAQQTAALNQNLPQEGPEPSDPGGTDQVSSDPTVQAAAARRAAQAATNIRTYGSKIADVSGYAAPTQQIALAIEANRANIMPAEMASRLLQSGSSTRLLPTQVGYQAATGEGGAQDTLIQSRGQSALDAASLSYGNAVDIANLKQSDADTIAQNIANQKIADANYQKSMGGILSGLGNLGLYGVGYRSGPQIKSGLSSLFG